MKRDQVRVRDRSIRSPIYPSLATDSALGRSPGQAGLIGRPSDGLRRHGGSAVVQFTPLSTADASLKPARSPRSCGLYFLVSCATHMAQVDNPVSFPFPFRLATWNLRYDVQPDTIPVATSLAALPDPRVAPPSVQPGEQPWSSRRVRVAQRLCASQVDLVGASRGERR